MQRTYSIKTSIGQTSLIESAKKPSFANVLKRGDSARNKNNYETPKSSKSIRQNNNSSKPLLSGKSSNTIGKPISPKRNRLNEMLKKPEKAVWISRLHRDTSEGQRRRNTSRLYGDSLITVSVVPKMQRQQKITSFSTSLSDTRGQSAQSITITTDIQTNPTQDEGEATDGFRNIKYLPICQNVRSVPAKTNLISRISISVYKVLCFTESWLTAKRMEEE